MVSKTMKYTLYPLLSFLTSKSTTTSCIKSSAKKRFFFSLFFFTCTTVTTLFPIKDVFEYTYGTTKVIWDGYIKADVWADSRQIIGDRYGQYLEYPRPKDLDICRKDKNAHGQYNMSVIESNIGVVLTGPKLGTATPQGALRVNFWGVSEHTAYLPRLLNTYVALDWEKDFLLLGQYENPLAATNCGPATISYNWGAPMQPQGLQPQIRYMHRIGTCNVTACLLTQVPDSISNGPIGFSTSYLRNSMLPEAVLSFECNDKKCMYTGSFEAKRLRPRLVNNLGNKVNETIGSFAAAAGIHYGSDDLRISSKITFAQNGVDQTLLSGYAVATRNNCDERTYTNLQAISGWLDISKPINKWTPGIFMGFAKNLGANHSLYKDPETGEFSIDGSSTIYSLDVDAEKIDYMFRIAPRVLFTQKPFQCGAELEYTAAAFGTVQDNGTVKNTDLASNVRLMVSFYYLF